MMYVRKELLVEDTPTGWWVSWARHKKAQYISQRVEVTNGTHNPISEGALPSAAIIDLIVLLLSVLCLKDSLRGNHITGIDTQYAGSEYGWRGKAEQCAMGRHYLSHIFKCMRNKRIIPRLLLHLDCEFSWFFLPWFLYILSWMGTQVAKGDRLLSG